jgi:hypothetical protein
MYIVCDDIAISRQNPNTLMMISVLDNENCYYKLDGLGMKVFLELKEGKSLETIRSNILEKYDVEADTLNRDIDTLINYLLENKIIEKK